MVLSLGRVRMENIKHATGIKVSKVSPVEQILSPIQQVVAAFLLSLLGGVVQVMNSKVELDLKRFLAGVFTAVFVGMITFLGLYETSIPLGLKGMIIGLLSYSSGEALPAAVKSLCAYIGRFGAEASLPVPTNRNTIQNQIQKQTEDDKC